MKKIFLFFLLGFILFLPAVLFHRSLNPVFFIWSVNYALFILLYLCCVTILLFLYLNIINLKYGVFLLCGYAVTFLLIDFIIGTINYNAHLPYKPHPVYHHTLKPGIYNKLRVSSEGFLEHNFTLTVNSQRLRSTKNIPLEKPINYYRILALGDSFTLGYGVNDDEVFSYLLENYLNKNSDLRYEVLNAGVSSHAPILEYLYLKSDGIKFMPDLVILFFDMSDLTDTQRYLKMAVKDKNNEIIAVRPYIDDKINNLINTFKHRFYFLSAIFIRIQKIYLKENMEKVVFSGSDMQMLKFALSENQAPWKKEWEDIYAHISLIRGFCKNKNIELLVVIYPQGYQVNNFASAKARKAYGIPENYTAPSSLFFELEKRLKQENILTLNLLQPFKEYKGELFFNADLHWARDGHKFIAQNLFSFMKSHSYGLKEEK